MSNKDLQIFAKMINFANEIEITLAEYNCEHDVVISSPTARNAITMCILQIGELVGNLSYETIENFPNVPWRLLRGIRNIAAHGYGKFDFEEMWNTATIDIPGFKQIWSKALEDS